MGHYPYLDGRDAALGLKVGDVVVSAHVYATRAGYLPGTHIAERRAFIAGFADYRPALSLDDDGHITRIIPAGEVAGADPAQ